MSLGHLSLDAFVQIKIKWIETIPTKEIVENNFYLWVGGIHFLLYHL